MADDEVEHVLQTLRATPQRIAALCRAQPAARLAAKGEPDEWSAQEILAHLRACAVVWGKGIHAMIAQEHPTLRYVSPRTWISRSCRTSAPSSASSNRRPPTCSAARRAMTR